MESVAAVVTREVRVEKEEEHHAEGHEIHVNAEDDTCVVEAPAALDAANGVQGPKDGEEGGKKDEEVGTAVGESGEEDGRKEREEDEQIGTKKRVTAEIEEVPENGVGVIRIKQAELHRRRRLQL
jgi:hypothetical protein